MQVCAEHSERKGKLGVRSKEEKVWEPVVVWEEFGDQAEGCFGYLLTGGDCIDDQASGIGWQGHRVNVQGPLSSFWVKAVVQAMFQGQWRGTLLNLQNPRVNSILLLKWGKGPALQAKLSPLDLWQCCHLRVILKENCLERQLTLISMVAWKIALYLWPASHCWSNQNRGGKLCHPLRSLWGFCAPLWLWRNLRGRPPSCLLHHDGQTPHDFDPAREFKLWDLVLNQPDLENFISVEIFLRKKAWYKPHKGKLIQERGQGPPCPFYLDSTNLAANARHGVLDTEIALSSPPRCLKGLRNVEIQVQSYQMLEEAEHMVLLQLGQSLTCMFSVQTSKLPGRSANKGCDEAQCWCSFTH